MPWFQLSLYWMLYLSNKGDLMKPKKTLPCTILHPVMFSLSEVEDEISLGQYFKIYSRRGKNCQPKYWIWLSSLFPFLSFKHFFRSVTCLYVSLILYLSLNMNYNWKDLTYWIKGQSYFLCNIFRTGPILEWYNGL